MLKIILLIIYSLGVVYIYIAISVFLPLPSPQRYRYQYLKILLISAIFSLFFFLYVSNDIHLFFAYFTDLYEEKLIKYHYYTWNIFISSNTLRKYYLKVFNTGTFLHNVSNSKTVFLHLPLYQEEGRQNILTKGGPTFSSTLYQ